jgi:hypothetical protein
LVGDIDLENQDVLSEICIGYSVTTTKGKILGWDLLSSGKFYRSIGNVTADIIKKYINDSQGKPKKKFQSNGLKKFRQLRLNDF